MININTYVKRFGNRTLDKHPFNDIDGLIFSQLSMINFETLLQDKETIALKDIVFANYRNTIYGSPDARANGIMLKNMMKAPRYRDTKVGYIRRYFSEEVANQFYAVTFILPNDTFFISFRGTDITIIGWKEDLYLTFMDKIPSHDQALAYTEEVLSKLSGQFYIGGHSKGGNLAVYSALNMNPDGIEQYPNYKNVEKKIKKFITHRDLIGLIFKDVPKYKIVYSNGALLGGHDPFAWRINENTGRFVLKRQCSTRSQVYALAINSWLLKMSKEDRELGTNALIAIVGKSKNIYDLLRYMVPNLAKFNWVIRTFPKEKRKRLRELISLFFKCLSDSRKTVNRRNRAARNLK